jgi:TrmH family RNA methyltransferase
MAPVITSVKNPRVKHIIRLGKRSYRERERQAVVEGGREVGLALDAGIVPIEVLLCPPLLDVASSIVAERCRALADAGRTELLEVSPDVFAKIAYRESTGGLVVVIPALDRSLYEIAPAGASLILVVDGAEKPGNIGALLRSADAAGVDLVFVCGAGTDINNSNVIRASLGAIFTVPVVQATYAEAVEWLRANGNRLLAATPDAGEIYTSVDMTGKIALVVGSEAFGISAEWRDACDVRLRIPMAGRVDSLNLSTSTAILLFEAVRQRSAA